MSKKFHCSNIREWFTLFDEYIYAKLGMIVQWDILSTFNSSDKMLGCESLLLSRVHLIKDGALRFCLLTCEEEMSHNAYRLIFIELSGCEHTSTRSPLGALNLTRYNSWDERLRLSHFKMIRWQTAMRHVPPSLSEDWWSWKIHTITCSRMCHITYT